MCTTYIGAVVTDKLKGIGVKFIDFPKLIRLNPNIPWKTRGNCSVAIEIQASDEKISTVKDTVLKTVKELAELHIETTNPGVVFYQGKKIPPNLKAFSKKAYQK